MSFDLEGQRAVVTGAARGIGYAIARRLKELGVDVVGWDWDPSGAASDPLFLAMETVDVSREEAVIEAAARLLERCGPVDILINNAGINGPTKPAWDYSLEEWNEVIAIDLTGVFLCCRAFLPAMRSRGYGRIITVASIAGKEGNPDACAYSAAKSGVVGFTKGLAREVIEDGITVNCVAPALTETDLFQEMSAAYIADRRAKIPMGRLCKPEEIADMVAWVASPRCGFTSGQIFDVSGGRATY